MARRGDVLRLKRSLGFVARGEQESVAVVQEDRLCGILPTLVVVPLDPAISTHAGNPLAVPVTAVEVAGTVDHVAVTTHMHVVFADRLAPGAVGRLSPHSLAAIDQALRLVLDL